MTTTELALPQSAAVNAWTPQQTRLMAFAGLAVIQGNGNVLVPDPGLAEAFIAICHRTGLDPFAKQIYAANMGGKLTIVVGIDGFRVIAQRSHEYRGQVGPQFTDGTIVPKYHPKTGAVIGEEMRWLDVWTKPGEPPFAARVGILRDGFKEPLWQVASWAEFGESASGPNWRVKGGKPAHMLGIRAESHALRRAFPNDLSGLYTPEDIDATADIESAIDDERIATLEGITDLGELRRQFTEWQQTGMSNRVHAAAMARAGAITPQTDQGDGQGGQDATETDETDENPSETSEPSQGHTGPQPDDEDEDVKIARRVMKPEDFDTWLATRPARSNA